MRDDPTVVDLVVRAVKGDQAAWNAIVDRYARLVYSICVRRGLSKYEIEDVGQIVWLRLVEKLTSLREPAALPGWLAATTHHQCGKVLRANDNRAKALGEFEADALVDQTAVPLDEALLIEERNIALRLAFAELPVLCKELLTLLTDDPPKSYEEIGALLGRKTGGLGPRRSRCLDKIRRHPAVAALIESSSTDLEMRRPS
jgi:RNA polymerase sigma factor (sigma-70 family)